MIMIAFFIAGFAYLLSLQAYKAYKDIKNEVNQTFKYVPPSCLYKPHPKYRVIELD